MLTITIPNNNLNERKYIIDIIFNEFLDVEFKFKIGGINYEISLENNNKLIIEDSIRHYALGIDSHKVSLMPKNCNVSKGCLYSSRALFFEER